MAGVYIVGRQVAKTFADTSASGWGTWPSEKRTAGPGFAQGFAVVNQDRPWHTPARSLTVAARIDFHSAFRG